VNEFDWLIIQAAVEMALGIIHVPIVYLCYNFSAEYNTGFSATHHMMHTKILLSMIVLQPMHP
jgi:hypothetical protein